VKPIGVSKKFDLLDVAASSHGPCTVSVAATYVAQVSVFDNLGDDSSPNVHKTPSPKRTGEKCASSPPSVSGEFLRFSFVLFTMGPNNFFRRFDLACALTLFAASEPR
jgi:hypothetical protein